MLADFDSLRQLPIADKLHVIELLWDDIDASDDVIPLPEWHRVEAERRSTELANDPSISLTKEELWRRVSDARDFDRKSK